MKYLQLQSLRSNISHSSNFGDADALGDDYKDSDGIEAVVKWFDANSDSYIDAISFYKDGKDGSDDAGHSQLFGVYINMPSTGYGNLTNDVVTDDICAGFDSLGIHYQRYTNPNLGAEQVTTNYDVYNSSSGSEVIPSDDEQANPKVDVTKAGNATVVAPPATTIKIAPRELADSPSTEQLRKVNVNTPDTNEFYKNCLLLLEGVSVPYNTITVSYGVDTPATCTLIIPAHKDIRHLPETLKIHIFFKDLCADDSGEYQYRLLFDGEMSGYSYNTNDAGAYMTIQGIHSCAYTTLMQLMTLDAAQYMFRSSTYIAGDATIPIMFSQNRMHSTMIDSLLKGEFASMADIVYQMMRGILGGNGATGTGKYYAKKLGNAEGGWKILRRIFGVSKGTANSAVPTIDWSAKVANEGAGSNKGSAGGSDSKRYEGPGSGVLGWPCASEPITSPFGGRDSPTASASSFHKGIDIGVDSGTEIHAAADGVVSNLEEGTGVGYGTYVSIDHGNGLVTIYGHLSGYAVADGTSVKKGDIIGYSGSTGDSTGPHLHFQVNNGGTAEDPMNYLS